MANEDPRHDTQLLTEETTEIQEPSFYAVILENDDYTSMDFVIQILMNLFDKSYEIAYNIMLEIHHQDQGIAGCYAKEIAIEKVNAVHELAGANDFPLRCHIEKA